MPDIRGITRGYMFTATRNDLIKVLKLVSSRQISPLSAVDLVEQYIISGRELPDYVPDYEPPSMIGEN